jgi:hypothetical protein
MAGSQLQARLQRVNRSASARLDRLDGFFPPQKEELPFEEYLARASVQARRDPMFRAQFDSAMRQYRAIKGVLHGS